MRESVLFLIALASAYAATALLVPLLKRRGVLDVPNARSSHKAPTPRGGGLGVVAGIAIALGFAASMGYPIPHWQVLAAAALVALIGAADDFFGGVHFAIRFAVHCVAASVVVYTAGGLSTLPLPEPLAMPLGLAGVPLSIVWLVAVTNIFNFLDGIDGYAGTQALLAGLALSLMADGSPIPITGLAIAGAAAGFLFHNWHPARIFMGDVGSTTLGFLLAALPWEAQGPVRSRGVFYVGLLLWFFLADGVFTLFRRLLRGEKVWKPHRSHLYQELAKRGLPHNTIVMRVGAMAAAVIALTVLAAAAASAPLEWSALAAATVCFLIYFRWAIPAHK